MTTKTPPEDLVNLCAKINREWLEQHDCSVEPYWLDGEFSEEWRVRLTHPFGVVDYITVEAISQESSGHTLFLFAKAFEPVHEAGIQLGKTEALSSINTLMHNAVFGQRR